MVACKYPVILVHGLMIRHTKRFKSFGKIENVLDNEGHNVYVSTHDGFGSIENNAEQLKEYVLKVLDETGAEKVNLIGHSKGGLDSKYLITHLGMEDKIASLTTLSTPHKGSIIASSIWKLPLWLKKIIAFFINTFYRILGDKHPDAMRACDQLRSVDESEETLGFSEKVYCQSYSTTLERGRDCFLMALPHKIYKHFENVDNDGLVSRESAKFGNYRGECLDISVSHAQIVDFASRKSQKEKIYDFYKKLCRELEEMGF
ncbi:MAG: hypothetical protein IJY23_01260 [Clostridia bacterium]|nr:hypothetical protein [Clostridia bacterium]